MNNTLRVIAIVLLLFNGLSACYGGLALMLYPGGEFLGMSIDLLEHAPFRSFFIPGTVLFVFNGLSSLAVALLVSFRHRRSGYFILGQGMLSSLWIVAEIMMLQSVNLLHLTYAFIGLCLLSIGLAAGGNRLLR